MFPGAEQLHKDAARTNGGSGWVKLVDDQPVRVTILGYVGTTTSKKYPEKTQYRYEASDGGVVKKLDANWRLSKALKDLAEQLQSPFEVTITQRKVIAEITDAQGAKSKKLVNDYTLTDVKVVAVADEEAPF
jgi:hypothetical protein